MKKRNLLLSGLLFSAFLTIGLTGCDKNNNNSSKNSSSSSNNSSGKEQNITLENLQARLENILLENEIKKSSNITFEEINIRGENRKYTTTENMTIYSDETSLAKGIQKYEFKNGSADSDFYEDPYQTICTTRTYNDQKVFYRVTDYENGTLNNSWHDSAYRLPVYETGNPSANGVSYLAEASVPGQIAKQVSLISSNFISSYLSGNPSLMTTMPYAKVVNKDNKTIYSLNNFKYSYSEDDGSSVDVLIEFELQTNASASYLLASSLRYQTTQSRGNEVYVEDLISNYTLSYDTRVASTTVDEMMNPEDYFLMEVNEVKAYIYNNGNKEYVNVDNLPLKSYIHFEASSYQPEKAVDLELYPVSSSNPSVVEVSSNIFETLATGEATLELESLTGVSFTVNVRINIPTISRLTYSDQSSDIEHEYDSNYNSIRYIYTNTTYNNIYLFIKPTGALASDVVVEVSDPEVLSVTQVSVAEGTITYRYQVYENNDSHQVSVTFKSKINDRVSETIVFNIKDRLSREEMVAKLTSHTYRWDNIYDKGWYALLTFSSDHEGMIQYYHDDSLEETVTFYYTFNETTFTPVMNTYFAMYNYNGGSITLDCNKIILTVNDVAYMHHYNIVED